MAKRNQHLVPMMGAGPLSRLVDRERPLSTKPSKRRSTGLRISHVTKGQSYVYIDLMSAFASATRMGMTPIRRKGRRG